MSQPAATGPAARSRSRADAPGACPMGRSEREEPVAGASGPHTGRSASMTQSTRGSSALAGLDGIMTELEDLYRDVHQHPELSMQEHRTANKAAERLRAAGYDVTSGV